MGINGVFPNSRSAWEAQKRNMAEQEEFERRYVAAQKRVEGEYLAILNKPRVPKAAHPPACENCGSSEYVPHHGRLICSYCRTAPDAPNVMHVDTTEAALTRFDLCYGHKVLRPEMLVRIAEDPITRPCKGEVTNVPVD